MSRRFLRRAATALALSSLLVPLAACGGGDDGDSATSGTVTLRYGMWDEVQKDPIRKSLDAFTQAHPDIKVEIELNPWDQYWSKLQTQLAGKSAPDVFWDHVAYFPQFAQQGVLTDLTADIAADKVDTSLYPQTLADSWKQDGKTYGLPKDWDTIGLIYSTKALGKAGLKATDLANLSWNTTDGGTFVQALQKLTVDKNGKHPNEAGFDDKNVKQYGLALQAPTGQQDWWNFGLQNGCKLQDAPWGKWTIDSPACVQAIQFVQDLRLKYHVAVPASVTNPPNGPSLDQVLGRGQAATSMDGSWMLRSYNTALPDGGFGVADLPKGPAGSGTVFNGLSEAISAGSKHPKEAWELVKYLASAEHQKIMAGSGTVWPGISSLNQDFAEAWKAKGVDVTGFKAAAEGTTMGYPLTSSSATYNVKALDAFNQVWLGKLSPGAAAKQVNDASNAAIK
ncbi:sugar ABC transporter substrate-binding protein [Actinocorallia longicatena]|uniref:Sugar ABC transporter substrate-binding protein n=1 Tax=Actinocorallia longicatena TaxID=111803 RepID=A0ABP6Q721_9ACTN